MNPWFLKDIPKGIHKKDKKIIKKNMKEITKETGTLVLLQ